jgi:hypothetical protein
VLQLRAQTARCAVDGAVAQPAFAACDRRGQRTAFTWTQRHERLRQALQLIESKPITSVVVAVGWLNSIRMSPCNGGSGLR